MRIALIFPPVFDPSMPYLGPYQVAAYMKAHMPDCQVDVYDLNIRMFNSILPNPYAGFGSHSHPTEAYLEIVRCEETIKRALADWSTEMGVRLERQGLQFGFDGAQSANVSKFLESESPFRDAIRDLYASNCSTEAYDVVGFSVAVYDQLIPSLIMAEHAKKTCSSTVTVMGGNIVSRLWEPLIGSELLAQVDFLVRAEGERPLCNLVKHLAGDAHHEPSNSLFDVRNGEFVDAAISDTVVDINSIPTTDLSGVNFDLYFAPRPVIPVSMSRGCSWGKCSFCGNHSGWSTGYRSRSVAKVADEISMHANAGITYFRLVDEGPSYADLMALSHELITRNLDVRIEAYCNLRRELADEDSVDTLFRAGIRQLFFGIESMDARVLRQMNKEINDPGAYAAILRNLSRGGISTYGYFMVGLPGDTRENEVDLERFIVGCRELNTIAISSFIPITNSPMYSDTEFLRTHGIAFELRGDLTTRCELRGGDGSLGVEAQKRARDILSRVFYNRPDIYVSSNIPYESRFHLCVEYGNHFAQTIALDDLLHTDAMTLSDELEQRAMGLTGGCSDHMPHTEHKPDGRLFY
jgi:anaerobic magnesium-protoporphyrin IX monomethyl ester cyclase